MQIYIYFYFLSLKCQKKENAYKANEGELRATLGDQNPPPNEQQQQHHHQHQQQQPSSETTKDCPKREGPTNPGTATATTATATSKREDPEPNFTSEQEQRKKKGTRWSEIGPERGLYETQFQTLHRGS